MEQGHVHNEATEIFTECSEIKEKIGRVQFIHCLREANGAAHEIARFCFFLHKLNCNWVDEPPDLNISKIVDDVTLLS